MQAVIRMPDLAGHAPAHSAGSAAAREPAPAAPATPATQATQTPSAAAAPTGGSAQAVAQAPAQALTAAGTPAATTASAPKPTAGPATVRAAAVSPPVALAVAAPRSPFWPLLLAVLALLTVLGAQAWQAHAERLQLQAALDAQAPTLAQAARLRGSLDGLAADTQRLADSGNASARLVVDELRKRGITIHPGAGTAPSATAAPR